MFRGFRFFSDFQDFEDFEGFRVLGGFHDSGRFLGFGDLRGGAWGLGLRVFKF